MSSYMEKILERMVNERLVWWAEKKNKLNEKQNGFRRGKSCIDNLTLMTADIEIAIRENGNVIAAFLDVASAYDNVRKDILVEKLIKERCPRNIIRYVNEWMKDRQTKFLISEEKEKWRVINKGLPQGGVLSPILYAIYTNEIHGGIDSRCHVLQYADDIAVYVVTKDKKVGIKDLELAVKKIDDNLKNIGLELQPEKIQLVDFNRTGYIKDDIQIDIKGHIIRGKEKAKFLGIVFDNKLKFDSQIEEIKGKVNKAVSILKYLNRVLWGMELNIAMLI